MQEVLIAGASGLLGSNLAKMFSKRFRVTATYNSNKIDIGGCRCVRADFSDRKSIDALGIDPSLIVNCIALPDVDRCEREPELARKANVLTARNIAEFAGERGAYLAHISTDAVFDGKKGDYKETDQTNPINVYGRTKLEAEKIVREKADKSCVLRTAIYGWNLLDKNSLAEWMLGRLENREELPAFNDIIFSPMLVNNLGKAIQELYDINHRGILHVSGSESCSKLRFAETLADVFSLDKGLIRETTSDTASFAAERPKNIGLDVSKAQAMLKTPLLGVRQGLEEFRMHRDTGYLEELRKGRS